MTDHQDIATIEDFGDRAGPLFVCEHASNAMPSEYNHLGLDPAVRQSHVAWDPGALPLARALARRAGGRLIHATVSRLLYDLNRPPESSDAVPERSEIHAVPGNMNLPPEARAARIESIYRPWVAALENALDPAPIAMVTVHSFTPVYFGVPRETQIGILHDEDPTMADAMLAEADRLGVAAERNRPYGPQDGVTHTLKVFALQRGLPNVMIEVRNDMLRDAEAIETMADTLTALLQPTLTKIRQQQGHVR